MSVKRAMSSNLPEYENPVRIGRISYMNVAPIYYELDRQPDSGCYDILSAPPAVLNQKMAAGELDISPVSTAACARHQADWLILPDLSISCDGPVMSVLLASRYDLPDLNGKSVVISDESASAAALLRLILKQQDVQPEIRCRKLGTGPSLPRTDAVLVIGDAALHGKWRKHYPYVWDLCGVWKEATGLPFVFALWAVRKVYAQKFPEQVAATFERLNQSRHRGCANLSAITAALKDRSDLELNVLKRYFNGLLYDLDGRKRQALQKFFTELHRYGLIPAPVTLDFVESLRRTAASHLGPTTDNAIRVPDAS